MRAFPEPSHPRPRQRAALLLAVVAIGSALAAAGTTAAAVDPEGYELCDVAQPGVHCGPGNGRTTPGGAGTGKVSHAGWPPITGELLIVDDQGRRAVGTPLNDELLGGHGSDQLVGDAGRDVLWGDQYATGNNTWQRDVVRGGPGNDHLYPSHGANEIHAGTGGDVVRAYYGHGTIDCGPGNDIAQVRTNGAYRLSNCERIVHFCAHGSHADGACRKPGEARRASTRRD